MPPSVAVRGTAGRPVSNDRNQTPPKLLTLQASGRTTTCSSNHSPPEDPMTATALPIDTTPAALSGTYLLDPAHARIGFVARHAMVTKVRGSFSEFEGTAELDSQHPEESSARLTIDAASIDTRNAQRDEHLRSNDFL